ncbi:hypothetical protein CP10139811_0624 [Chlamydia ibidis]|uniref:Uncharacterized protein n=3 Tax=Chlamydia ibidis TaxID=1405396 RepID=S7J1Y9_9CHLA|nr:hypothetical protein CP10139811_0624 [Chlamydia ibidis]EQM62286.1 hypothetical protein H359_1008 [Chlamydia ibidis 10-1398/6]
MLSWYALTAHALAKRVALSLLASDEVRQPLSREIEFLETYRKMSWRKFLKYSYDILFAFSEMEQALSAKLEIVISSLDNMHNSNNDIVGVIEDFWARDNLFAFETAAYEQAVDKYLAKRTQITLWPVAFLFRFFDLPVIRFQR